MWKRPNHRFITHLAKNCLNNEAHNIANAESMVNKTSISKTFYRSLFTSVNSNVKLLSVAQTYMKNTTLLNFSDIKTSTNSETNNESTSAIRTPESDPRNHDERHLGRIYSMPGRIFISL